MPTEKPHAVLFASPGMGHLIPILELGQTLVNSFNFEATIFVLASGSSVAESDELLKSPNPDKLHIISLPQIDISSILDPSAPLGAKLLVSMNMSVPNLRSAILSMTARPSVLIVDLFGAEAFAIAEELNMLKYFFMTTGAWFLALQTHIPHLDVKNKEDHMLRYKPLRIPGCEPVRFEDTNEIFEDLTGEAYETVSVMSMNTQRADAILVNTFEDLEPKTLKALRDPKMFGGSRVVPVYPIGPLVRDVGPKTVEENRILSWLDSQPLKSVVYISFGSGGALSAKQLEELAWGLESSQQRFIWVVRPPVENDSSGSYFNIGGKRLDETPDYLPSGFVTRAQEKGLLVPMWAPQAHILKHPSIGAFVSHCGWNSTLESIINGVPMIAWPLYAEQKMNAVLLTEHLGIAVGLRPPATGAIEREEISKAVRKIMVDNEGEAIRTRVENMKNMGLKATSKSGYSYSSLSKAAHECELNLQLLRGKAHGA